MADIATISYQAANESAKQQMEFQKMMSNTAHQREVADLKAAGLNPVLSGGGQGAQVTAGAEGYVGDANAKLFDEQVAAYEIAQKELDQKYKLDLINAETNAKLLLQEAKAGAKVASSGKGSGKSTGTGKASSGKASSNKSVDSKKITNNATSWTGIDYLDEQLNNIAKKKPAIGLVLAAGKYAIDNGKVGKNISVTGSSAKAKAKFEKDQKAAAAAANKNYKPTYLYKVGH